MSHYAKLATIGFRWMGVAVLLYSIPNVIMMLSFESMPGVGRMRMLVLTGLLHPILGLILFLAAKPLGELVTQGLD